PGFRRLSRGMHVPGGSAPPRVVTRGVRLLLSSSKLRYTEPEYSRFAKRSRFSLLQAGSSVRRCPNRRTNGVQYSSEGARLRTARFGVRNVVAAAQFDAAGN